MPHILDDESIDFLNSRIERLRDLVAQGCYPDDVERIERMTVWLDELGAWVHRHAPQTQNQSVLERNGRSTPREYLDCQHVWDADGRLWCYSEPTDVWKMREMPTPAAFVAPHSARSYQRLLAEFGPLRPYEG